MPQFIIDFGNWLYDILYAFVSTVGVLLENILLTVMDGFFLIGRLALDGIGLLLQPFNVQQYFSALPPEFAGMMVRVGMPECIGMIVSALLIRMTLQLIPFTRLGS